MRNFIPFLIISILVLSISSCKDEVEDAIDCTVESWFLSLETEVDNSNPLLVHFTFVNADTIDNQFTLDESLTWDFGDGNQEVLQEMETSHLYTGAGTYKVSVFYTLRKGSSSCSSSKDTEVTLAY